MSFTKSPRHTCRQEQAAALQAGLTPDLQEHSESPAENSGAYSPTAKACMDSGNRDAELIADRRSFERYRTTYRPCCVLAAQTVTMGLIRNISLGGARVEIDADFEVGETIRYFCETNACIAARIAWRDGNTYGLEHLHKAREAVK